MSTEQIWLIIGFVGQTVLPQDSLYNGLLAKEHPGV